MRDDHPQDEDDAVMGTPTRSRLGSASRFGTSDRPATSTGLLNRPSSSSILPQAVDNHRAVVAGARDSHRGAAVSDAAKHRIQHRIHDHHITSNVSHEDAADGSVRITR
jgi:hypothetical protein